MSVCECAVSRTQCTVHQRERKVRRTLTSTRFQLHMPTVTTNTGLKCCFKLCVYLFYLLKKTLHTYTHYLDKYKTPKSLFLFSRSARRRVGLGFKQSLMFLQGSGPFFSVSSQRSEPAKHSSAL